MLYFIWGMVLLTTFTVGFYFGYRNGRITANTQTVKQLEALIEAQVASNKQINMTLASTSKRCRSKRLGVDSLDLDC
jgi:cell division protein FtsB